MASYDRTESPNFSHTSHISVVMAVGGILLVKCSSASVCMHVTQPSLTAASHTRGVNGSGNRGIETWYVLTGDCKTPAIMHHIVCICNVDQTVYVCVNWLKHCTYMCSTRSTGVLCMYMYMCIGLCE